MKRHEFCMADDSHCLCRFIKMDLVMNLMNFEIVSSSVVQSYSITILVRQPNCWMKNKHCMVLMQSVDISSCSVVNHHRGTALQVHLQSRGGGIVEYVLSSSRKCTSRGSKSTLTVPDSYSSKYLYAFHFLFQRTHSNPFTGWHFCFKQVYSLPKLCLMQ